MAQGSWLMAKGGRPDPGAQGGGPVRPGPAAPPGVRFSKNSYATEVEDDLTRRIAVIF